MGAGNVKAAYARWGHLDHGPMRVLVFMAVTALDEPEPRFWGGREVLSCALGRIVADPSTTDPAEIAERRAAFKSLDRMIAPLVKAGAIRMVSRACPGRNAVYALNLAASLRSPVTGDQPGECTPASGDRSDDEWSPVSGTNGPRSAGQWSPVSGAMVPGQRGPEEYYEEVGLNPGEMTADRRTAVTLTRASGPGDENPSSMLRLIDGNPDASGPDGQRPLLPAVVPGGGRAAAQAIAAAASARRASARAGDATG